MLETLITSKTRIKLLLKFFSNESNKAYLRSLAEEFGESTNAVRLELNRLSDAGLLQSENVGNTILYRANAKHPVYKDIKSLVSKYFGFDQIVETVIERLGNLDAAVVVGDYAKGLDSGIIDLRLVGYPDREYLEKLIAKTEKLIHRNIRYSVQPPDSVGLGYDFEKQPHIVLWNKV